MSIRKQTQTREHDQSLLQQGDNSLNESNKVDETKKTVRKRGLKPTNEKNDQTQIQNSSSNSKNKSVVAPQVTVPKTPALADFSSESIEISAEKCGGVKRDILRKDETTLEKMKIVILTSEVERLTKKLHEERETNRQELNGIHRSAHKDIDEPDAKKRAITFIPEIPSIFNGEGDYEEWWSEVTDYLYYFDYLTEEEKVRRVNSFICGPAYLILDMESRKRTMNVKDIDAYMRKIFVLDTNILGKCIDTVQLPGEDSLKFLNRLRVVVIKTLSKLNNLDLMKVNNETLGLFVRNTRPEIRERLNLVMPSTIESALGIAIQIESEEEEKKLNQSENKVENAERETEEEDEVEEEKDNRVEEDEKWRKMNERINVMEQYATEILYNNQRGKLHNNNNSPNANKNKFICCFFCKKYNHSFQRCHRATEADKQKIRDMLKTQKNSHKLKNMNTMQ